MSTPLSKVRGFRRAAEFRPLWQEPGLFFLHVRDTGTTAGSIMKNVGDTLNITGEMYHRGPGTG